MFKIKYLIIILLYIGFFTYLITTGINYVSSKPFHIIRYELYSDNGLWGRFDWNNINFFGRYTSTKKFIRDVYLFHTFNTIKSEVYSTPFKIFVEGNFKNYTILKIYVDDELIETVDGNYFSSEWMLSEDCWRSDSQNSSWTSQWSNHHIGHTSNGNVVD